MAPGETAVLKDDSVLTGSSDARDTQATPTLEVFALGPGQVLLNGRLVDTWDGTLPRLLMFFALDRPAVTRADICHAFWPELPIDQAVNVFHVTKRRMHKALGYDVLEFEQERGGYFISKTVNLHYDAVDFVDELVSARGISGAEAARYWQRAIDIYRGDYLEGQDTPWIVNRRQDFQAGYTEALSALAQIRENEGQTTQALGLYSRASSNAPGRADLAETVNRLQSAVG
jgi:two-component SAPR family response regulator